MVNLIINPGFEEANPTNTTKPLAWTLQQYTYGETPPYTGKFPIWTTDQTNTGTKSIKFDLTIGIDGITKIRGGSIYSDKITINPTIVYKVGVFVKGQDVGAGPVFEEPYLRISEYNSVGTYTKFTQWNIHTGGTSNWTNKEFTFKPRTDTISIRVETTHTWNNGILWVDDYTLEETLCNNSSCLISYWNFDEATGNIVADSINNNLGSTYNTTIVPGAKGNAQQFNGINSYITMGAPSSLDFGTSNFTISSFVKTNSIIQRNIVEKRLGSPLINPGFAIAITTTGILIAVIQDGINKVVTFADTTLPVLNNNIWHHIAVVFDRTNGFIKKYIDGIHVGIDDNISTVTGSINTTQSFEVGRFYGSGSSTYFNGTLDEIKVWSKVLSESEILIESSYCSQPICSFYIS